jgi:hypothetical protein
MLLNAFGPADIFTSTSAADKLPFVPFAFVALITEFLFDVVDLQ